jgi:TM2 domain-containing membrane protein YozV
MAEYYVRRGAKIVGPIPLEKFKQIAVSGKILGTDQIAQKFDGPWLPFASVKRLLLAEESPLRDVEPRTESLAEATAAHKPPRVSVRRLSQARMAIQERDKRRQERQIETLRANGSQFQDAAQDYPGNAASTLKNICAPTTVEIVTIPKASETSKRSRLVAITLAVLLGGFAVHKMYLGQPWARRLLLACTGVGLVVTTILAVLDAIALLRMSQVTFEQRQGA